MEGQLNLGSLEATIHADVNFSLEHLIESKIQETYIRDYGTYSVKAFFSPKSPSSVGDDYPTINRGTMRMLSMQNDVINLIVNALNENYVYAKLKKDNIIGLGNGRFLCYNGHSFEYVTNEYRFDGKDSKKELELLAEEHRIASKCLNVLFTHLSPLFIAEKIEKGVFELTSAKKVNFKKSLLVEKYKNDEVSRIIKNKKIKIANIFLDLLESLYLKKYC